LTFVEKCEGEGYLAEPSLIWDKKGREKAEWVYVAQYRLNYRTFVSRKMNS